MDDEIEFGDSENKRDPPLFENEDHGITAWINEDKNGNYYLVLRLPLGLGTVPLFVNDSGYDDGQSSFNRLVDHIRS